jgi:hypothetical protein
MFQVYVSKYFSCFKRMLQVFYLDIAYVAVTIYMYVASVCSKCFTCFRPMLQVFYLDVAYGSNIRCKRLSNCFVVSDVCYKCVYLDLLVAIHICCKRMLQVCLSRSSSCYTPVSNACCRSAFMLQH